jgi:hypothetical protein
MRKLMAILVATVMACTFAPIIGAQESANIDIYLEPSATVEISCTQTEWAPDASLGYNESTETDWATLSNIGDVAVLIEVSVANPTNWTIGAIVAHNVFSMNITDNDTKTNTALTTDAQVWIGSLEPPGNGGSPDQLFGLSVEMPTSSSTDTEQVVILTLAATAL